MRLDEEKHLRGQFSSFGIFPAKRFIVWLVYAFRFFANSFAHDICCNKLKHGMFFWW